MAIIVFLSHVSSLTAEVERALNKTPVLHKKLFKNNVKDTSCTVLIAQADFF